MHHIKAVVFLYELAVTEMQKHNLSVISLGGSTNYDAPINEFNMDMALDEIPVSGCTCFSTCMRISLHNRRVCMILAICSAGILETLQCHLHLQDRWSTILNRNVRLSNEFTL